MSSSSTILQLKSSNPALPDYNHNIAHIPNTYANGALRNNNQKMARESFEKQENTKKDSRLMCTTGRKIFC